MNSITQRVSGVMDLAYQAGSAKVSDEKVLMVLAETKAQLLADIEKLEAQSRPETMDEGKLIELMLAAQPIREPVITSSTGIVTSSQLKHSVCCPCGEAVMISLDRRRFISALNTLRKNRKLSVRDLAKEVGTSPATTSRVLRGNNLDADTLMAFAYWSKLDLREFFKGK